MSVDPKYAQQQHPERNIGNDHLVQSANASAIVHPTGSGPFPQDRGVDITWNPNFNDTVQNPAVAITYTSSQ